MTHNDKRVIYICNTYDGYIFRGKY